MTNERVFSPLNARAGQSDSRIGISIGASIGSVLDHPPAKRNNHGLPAANDHH
jgi:hypothetical protein